MTMIMLQMGLLKSEKMQNPEYSLTTPAAEDVVVVVVDVVVVVVVVVVVDVVNPAVVVAEEAPEVLVDNVIINNLRGKMT